MVNILRDILDEEIKPVYIFTGNDGYTKEKLAKEIEKKLTEKYGSCNFVTFDGKENTAQEIIAEASNSSLFTSIGLIIVKRGDILLSDESFKKFLEDFFQKDNPPNIVIIETEKERAFKKLKQDKINTPYENQLPGWIKKSFSSKGKHITDDAANLLAFYCGRNLFNITREIEKIITAYPDKETYHIEEVRNIAGSHKKDDIFGYLNALVDGNEKKSLVLLEDLLKFGTEPIQIVGMLKWKLQQMITARALMEKGLNEKDILEKMNLMPRFFYRGFCSKLKKYPRAKLLENYNRLFETDLELKTASTDKFLHLEKFTFQFLSG